MIDRRRFIVALVAPFLAAVRNAANAQPAARIWRIGFLANVAATDPAAGRVYEALWRTLQERGYAEGKNLVIERRFADGSEERFPALAAELVTLGPDLIVAVSGPATVAAKAATSTIPIVMSAVSDPVGRGLVPSLAHPGANLTGTANLQGELTLKRLELLKSAVPQAARVVFISNAAGIEATRLASEWKEQDAAAKRLGVTLVRLKFSAPSEWPSVTEAIARERPDALVLAPTPVNFNRRRDIAEFAIKLRLPTIGGNRDQVVAGFLMSYGSDSEDVLRHTAVYVEKILEGAKPGDLPIEQPTTFRLAINLKTAKALGLTVPQSLLLRADEVIQ